MKTKTILRIDFKTECNSTEILTVLNILIKNSQYNKITGLNINTNWSDVRNDLLKNKFVDIAWGFSKNDFYIYDRKNECTVFKADLNITSL